MLHNKVIIITGAAGGIARSLTQLLIEQGARLVLTDINYPALTETANLLPGKSPVRLLLRHDVRDPQSWQQVINRTLNDFGQIDILINNAGIVEPALLEALPAEKIRQQLEVNLLGTILGCQAVIPPFKQYGKGHIINIASLGGIVPMPGEAVYSATKFGIRGFSLSLRAELQNSGISVSVVCPDSVETSQLQYELRHEEAILSFVGKPLQPQTVAEAIVRAIRSHRAEVLIPSIEGGLVRVAMAFPGLFFRAFPVLERIARRRQEKLRSAEQTNSMEVNHVR